ncbi:polysaccharide biosynthesis protein, partial [Flavobacteriaceae bacterium]|nr:polysaccharide biosynthesis protein [Flavobacteriaceae bacterium]
MNDLINETILITGGTGSLGQGLARELFKNNKVIIYSRNEERQHEMRSKFNNENLKFIIGDIRDFDTMKDALSGVTVAIHSAAMKDTIYCEEQPYQTILNNIEGSSSFIKACKQSKSLKKVIAISTDKAASPSSVYGCSKYIMEKLFVEASQYVNFDMFVVRFGNLIDSKGSLINTWKADPQSDIKITHTDVSRFFFSIKEAKNTILDSIKLCSNGDIIIKKMKAAYIRDVLKVITGKENFEQIGLFPGEKLHELLLSDSEAKFCIELDDYFIISNNKNQKT